MLKNTSCMARLVGILVMLFATQVRCMKRKHDDS